MLWVLVKIISSRDEQWNGLLSVGVRQSVSQFVGLARQSPPSIANGTRLHKALWALIFSSGSALITNTTLYAIAGPSSPGTVTWHQGRCADFLVGGGTNRRQVANLSPKYPKNRKKTPDSGGFILETGGDVPF